MAVDGTEPGNSGLYYDLQGHKQRWNVDDWGTWTLEQEWVKDEVGEWQEIEVLPTSVAPTSSAPTGGYDGGGLVAWGERNVCAIDDWVCGTDKVLRAVYLPGFCRKFRLIHRGFGRYSRGSWMNYGRPTIW